MKRQVSTRLGPLSGLMLGIALPACATAISAPCAPAPDESGVVRAGADRGSTGARFAPSPSHDRASTAVRSQGRAQPADAHRTLRTSHLRASAASASERVYAAVHQRTRTLDASLRARIAREILVEAARAGIDPLLIVALIQVESTFDPDAVSSAGATGLMQLRAPTMGDVAARFGLPSTDRLDAVANIQAGVRYLSGLLKAFGDVEVALMAYNAGPGRIRGYLREGGVPERFWAYPESVARELGRLGGSLDTVRARLAVDDDRSTGLGQMRKARSPASAPGFPPRLADAREARSVLAR